MVWIVFLFILLFGDIDGVYGKLEYLRLCLVFFMKYWYVFKFKFNWMVGIKLYININIIRFVLKVF